MQESAREVEVRAHHEATVGEGSGLGGIECIRDDLSDSVIGERRGERRDRVGGEPRGLDHGQVGRVGFTPVEADPGPIGRLDGEPFGARPGATAHLPCPYGHRERLPIPTLRWSAATEEQRRCRYGEERTPECAMLNLDQLLRHAVEQRAVRYPP